MAMNKTCDNCHLEVDGLISVSGPGEMHLFDRHWCFACVYEKGLADSNERKQSKA